MEQGRNLMRAIYGEIPNSIIIKNVDDLIGQVFKLLPYKEKHIENLENHFSALLFRIVGMCSLFPDNPELLTVAAVLEAAKSEADFYLYRKAILDSCSILKRLQEQVGSQDD